MFLLLHVTSQVFSVAAGEIIFFLQKEQSRGGLLAALTLCGGHFVSLGEKKASLFCSRCCRRRWCFAVLPGLFAPRAAHANCNEGRWQRLGFFSGGGGRVKKKMGGLKMPPIFLQKRPQISDVDPDSRYFRLPGCFRCRKNTHTSVHESHFSLTHAHTHTIKPPHAQDATHTHTQRHTAHPRCGVPQASAF